MSLETDRDYYRKMAEESEQDAALWTQLADEIDAYLESEHRGVVTEDLF